MAAKPSLLLALLLLMQEYKQVLAFSSFGVVTHRRMGLLHNNVLSASMLRGDDDEGHWMNFLTYDGNPTFDVLEKTKEYSSLMEYDKIEKYYDDKYVFRGSVIGPITARDVRNTQQNFKLLEAYPDIQIKKFGYTIDPDNPYRCYWFERWSARNSAEIKLGPLSLPRTNKAAKLPTHVMSVNWTPSGKIIYACLSSPLDRFEGNTNGQGAVFGLLESAGAPLPISSPGNPLLIFNQKLVAPLISQKAFSSEQEIPSWWKSKSRGADPNDM